MPHRINESLLRRIHTEYRKRLAVSTGLMFQLQEAQRWQTTVAGQLAAARQRLVYFDTGVPDPGQTIEDLRQRRAVADQQTFDNEDELRRRLPAHQWAAHVAQLQRADVSEYRLAVREAAERCAAAEREVARIIEVQGEAGSKAGELRQTLTEAAAWLSAAGRGVLAAEISR